MTDNGRRVAVRAAETAGDFEDGGEDGDGDEADDACDKDDEHWLQRRREDLYVAIHLALVAAADMA